MSKLPLVSRFACASTAARARRIDSDWTVLTFIFLGAKVRGNRFSTFVQEEPDSREHCQPPSSRTWKVPGVDTTFTLNGAEPRKSCTVGS